MFVTSPCRLLFIPLPHCEFNDRGGGSDTPLIWWGEHVQDVGPLLTPVGKDFYEWTGSLPEHFALKNYKLDVCILG